MDISINENKDKIDLEKLIPVSEKAAEAQIVSSSEKKLTNPEGFSEKIDEKKPEKPVDKNPEVVKSAAVPTKPASLTVEQERARVIDRILSDGLHDIFLQLDPIKQKEFKQAGEETVAKINSLLQKAKIKVDKIVDLIRKWLKIIPGVNRFFLEQEAKIKADRIMRLKN